MLFRHGLLALAFGSACVSAFYPYHLNAGSDSGSNNRLRSRVVRRTNNYKIYASAQPTLPNSAAVDEDGADISYFSTAKFGSSGTPLHMLLDTGAANTWIMGSDCTSKACAAHTTFGASESSTFATTGQPWNVTYGKGSVNGQVVNDTISFAGFNIPLSFGSASQVSDDFLGYTMDGIFGLARPDPAEANLPTIMTVIAGQNKLKANVIGVNLERASDGATDGEINFGAWDQSKFTGPLTWTNTVATNGLWEIAADDAGVGGQAAKFKGKSAIIDTGTSYVLMPPDDAKQLHSQFPKYQQDNETFEVPCSSTQPIQFTFSGTTFNVSPKDYLGPATSGGFCYTYIVGHQPFGPDQWLLGDTFLKNVYTVFDFDQNRIGFGAKGAAASSSSAPASAASSSPSSTAPPPAGSLVPPGGSAPSAAPSRASAGELLPNFCHLGSLPVHPLTPSSGAKLPSSSAATASSTASASKSAAAPSPLRFDLHHYYLLSACATLIMLPVLFG
ncbi:MAG: hypothetical protein M1838_006099 [Thelocarpon superellum]|nr:MAG: hypothetical protein M1838_006099 [Thelocarpon superellum]